MRRLLLREILFLFILTNLVEFLFTWRRKTVASMRTVTIATQIVTLIMAVMMTMMMKMLMMMVMMMTMMVMMMTMMVKMLMVNVQKNMKIPTRTVIVPNDQAVSRPSLETHIVIKVAFKSVNSY